MATLKKKYHLTCSLAKEVDSRISKASRTFGGILWCRKKVKTSIIIQSMALRSGSLLQLWWEALTGLCYVVLVCDPGSVKMGPEEEYRTASESRNWEGGRHSNEEKNALAGSLGASWWYPPHQVPPCASSTAWESIQSEDRNGVGMMWSLVTWRSVTYSQAGVTWRMRGLPGECWWMRLKLLLGRKWNQEGSEIRKKGE